MTLIKRKILVLYSWCVLLSSVPEAGVVIDRGGSDRQPFDVSHVDGHKHRNPSHTLGRSR